MKMEIVFDLQKALAGAPVVTKDGRKVRELKLFDTVQDFPLVGVLYGGEVQRWNKFGIAREAHNDESNLTMVRVKKEGWVNLYRGYAFDGTPRQSVTVGGGEVFPSEEWAAGWRCNQSKEDNKNFVACVHIEWEE